MEVKERKGLRISLVVFFAILSTAAIYFGMHPEKLEEARIKFFTEQKKQAEEYLEKETNFTATCYGALICIEPAKFRGIEIKISYYNGQYICMFDRRFMFSSSSSNFTKVGLVNDFNRANKYSSDEDAMRLINMFLEERPHISVKEAEVCVTFVE